MLKVYGAGRGKGREQPSGEVAGKRKEPGEIRLQTELDELELPPGGAIDFPDKNNLMCFYVTLVPDEGFWRKGSFAFSFSVPGGYPHDAPKVKCDTKVYHPNIDTQGNVCLNILREDWNPVLSISSIIYGLLHLFLEPNPTDPLNHEAAELLRRDRWEFGRTVARNMYI